LTTIQTKQVLENSNAKSPIYPDDVGHHLDLEGTFNIETLELTTAVISLPPLFFTFITLRFYTLYRVTPNDRIL